MKRVEEPRMWDGIKMERRYPWVTDKGDSQAGVQLGDHRESLVTVLG